MTTGAALLALPPYVRRRLAHGLATGAWGSPPSDSALRDLVDDGTMAAAVAADLAALAALGIAGRAAAAWVEALSDAPARRVPELVWSGPAVAGLPARSTHRVYEDLVAGATRSLLVSTYAFHDGARVFASLARRLDEVPGLRLTLLVNIARRRGDTTAAEPLVQRFARSFWDAAWPGTSSPAVFYDPRCLDEGGSGGVLHAKAVVSDEESVLVTSANLTEAAHDRNIELGMLVRDRALALSVLAHFQTLIDRGHLWHLPPP